MNLLIHIARQVKNFLKFPNQFLKILGQDIKKDFFIKNNKKYNNILVIGHPKSGTTLIEWLLTELGYVNQKVSPLRIFYEKELNEQHDLSFQMLKYIPKNKATFLKRQSAATDKNIKIINKFKIKLIISKRNLRDTMISRYLHLISDKNLPHYSHLKDLNYIDGFKKSLTHHPMGYTPIKYFNNWIKNWNRAIKENNFDCLVLDYDDYIKNDKSYVEKLLKYLSLKNIDSDKLIQNHYAHLKKLKNKNLTKNLKNNLFSQTYNFDFSDTKKQLKSNFPIEKFNNIVKNLI